MKPRSTVTIHLLPACPLDCLNFILITALWNSGSHLSRPVYRLFAGDRFWFFCLPTYTCSHIKTTITRNSLGFVSLFPQTVYWYFAGYKQPTHDKACGRYLTILAGLKRKPPTVLMVPAESVLYEDPNRFFPRRLYTKMDNLSLDFVIILT